MLAVFQPVAELADPLHHVALDGLGVALVPGGPVTGLLDVFAVDGAADAVEVVVACVNVVVFL